MYSSKKSEKVWGVMLLQSIEEFHNFDITYRPTTVKVRLLQNITRELCYSNMKNTLLQAIKLLLS